MRGRRDDRLSASAATGADAGGTGRSRRCVPRPRCQARAGPSPDRSHRFPGEPRARPGHRPIGARHALDPSARNRRQPTRSTVDCGHHHRGSRLNDDRCLRVGRPRSSLLSSGALQLSDRRRDRARVGLLPPGRIPRDRPRRATSKRRVLADAHPSRRLLAWMDGDPAATTPSEPRTARQAAGRVGARKSPAPDGLRSLLMRRSSAA
jgi:hypothetical protein